MMTDSENSYQVVMPKLGLTMTEANIVDWHKEDGAVVEAGELLFTLETEKSTLDIDAPATGVLHILYPVGETVPVKMVIATIGRGDAKSIASESPTSAQFTEPPPVAETEAGRTGSGPRGRVVAADVAAIAQPVAAGGEDEASVNASPVALRVAKCLGIDLHKLTGTGPGGRITRADVDRAAREIAAGQPPRVKAAPVHPESIQPLSSLRAVIAERMTKSWQEQPQVTLFAEVDATNLVSVCAQLNTELDEKLSYDVFFLKAAAQALCEQPHINVQFADAGLAQLSHQDIGVAVSSERGLLVPVVRDPHKQDILTLNRELAVLTERALAGHCLPDDFLGGSLTVMNLGIYEVDSFTPILNPPQSTILGVGRIVSKPAVVEGQVVVREMLVLSLSFDHRVIDGEPAARFLQRIRHLVECPAALLLH